MYRTWPRKTFHIHTCIYVRSDTYIHRHTHTHTHISRRNSMVQPIRNMLQADGESSYTYVYTHTHITCSLVVTPWCSQFATCCELIENLHIRMYTHTHTRNTCSLVVTPWCSQFATCCELMENLHIRMYTHTHTSPAPWS